MLVLAVNPGSTSTRVALYRDGLCVDNTRLAHEEAVLDLPLFPDQYALRKESILAYLAAQGMKPGDLDAVAARGGRLKPLRSGVYRVDEQMVRHAEEGLQGIHPANTAVVFAYELEREYGVPGFTVDPISVDELDPVARITGIAGLERSSLSHALSMKSVARRASRELGLDYGAAKLIVAHLGGGGSVSAHVGGRMVDLYNSDQEGPFAVERAGALPTLRLLEYLAAQGLSYEAGVRRLAHAGGLYSHLGTRDIETVVNLAGQDCAGGRHAASVLAGYLYQIAKAVASFLPLMAGKADAVVFTGGVIHNSRIRAELEASLAFMGRLLWYPGEFEMDALAQGVESVLCGRESALAYS